MDWVGDFLRFCLTGDMGIGGWVLLALVAVAITVIPFVAIAAVRDAARRR